jgi:hypothetical protein
MQASAEAAPLELLDLGQVLAADIGVAEDEDVVEVDVGVGPAEIG